MAPHAVEQRGGAVGELVVATASRHGAVLTAIRRRPPRRRRRGSRAPCRPAAALTTSGGAMRTRALPARQHQQPALEARLLDRLGRVVIGEVEPDHQAAAAHAGDHRLAIGQGARARRGAGRPRARRWRPARSRRGRASPAPRRRRPGSHRTSNRACRPSTHDVGAGDQRRQRQPAGETLAGGDHVGDDAVVLACPHPPGATDAGLHLVDHEQDAVPVAQRRAARPANRRAARRNRPRPGSARRRSAATSPGSVMRSNSTRLDVVGAGDLAVEGERSVVAAGRDDAEAAAVLRLRRRQRQRAERAPVEAAVEGDHVRAARCGGGRA